MCKYQPKQYILSFLGYIISIYILVLIKIVLNYTKLIAFC